MLQNNSNQTKEGLAMATVDFNTKEDNLHYRGVVDVSPEEVFEKLDQIVLIDVRQPEEFTGELGHIPTAKLVVLDTLDEKAKEIPNDQTVVFVCRSGGRSARAVAWAHEQGLKNVYNMKGGMLLWNELHLETEI